MARPFYRPDYCVALAAKGVIVAILLNAVPATLNSVEEITQKAYSWLT